MQYTYTNGPQYKKRHFRSESNITSYNIGKKLIVLMIKSVNNLIDWCLAQALIHAIDYA